MIGYRPFRNNDPPAISEIWRSQQPTRAVVPTMSPAVLDRLVLSKPYFDREGLIVAEDGDRPVGFGHAGFGSDEEGKSLNHADGVTCLVMVVPHESHDQIAAGLLERCESYLRERGATRLFGGAAPPLDPFYLGMIGGSSQPGVPTSFTSAIKLFEQNGYREHRRYRIYERSLASFRPVVNRKQMQNRRQYQVEPTLDPPANSWWEACTVAYEHRTRFALTRRGGGAPRGQIMFWDMEPLASSRGVHAAGMSHIEIEPDLQGQGLAVFLAGEALRQFQSHGVTLVEAQATVDNIPAAALMRALGFETVDEGVMFVKNESNADG